MSKMNKSISTIISIVMLMVVAVFASASVNADNFGYTPGIDVLYVKVNGDQVSENETIRTNLERDQELEVLVKLQSHVNLTDVEVSSYISGYEYNDDDRISDVEYLPDVEANVEYPIKLELELPQIVEKDDYKLRVAISDRYSSLASFNYNLKVDAPEYELKIRDIILSPAEKVKAGRSLIANVRLKNIGSQDEEDIRVEAEVEELGISDVTYINEIEEDDSETSDDLLLRIPVEAEPGLYTLKTTTEFNNDHDKVVEEVEFEVLESDLDLTPSDDEEEEEDQEDGADEEEDEEDSASGNILINYDSNSKVLTQGEGGSIYSMTITNEGNTAKSFIVDVSGVDWATVRLSPGNVVVVEPGQSKAVYVYTSANENAEVGTHDFNAVIKSDSEVIGTATFNADVVESSASFDQTSFNTILTYLLIALVIVLALIVVVLIVTKNKGGRKGEEEEFDATQSYY